MKKDNEKLKMANQLFLKNCGFDSNDELWKHGLLVYYVENGNKLNAYGVSSDRIESRTRPEENIFSSIRHTTLRLYSHTNKDIFIDNIVRNCSSFGVPYNILLLAYDNEKFYKISFGQKYDESLFKKIYTVAFNINYIDNYNNDIKRELKIYKNNDLIHLESHVNEYNYINNKLLYSIPNNDKYDIFEYDLKHEKRIYLGSVNDWEMILNVNFTCYKILNSLPKFEVTDNNLVSFLFSFSESKPFYILYEFMQTADDIKIIKSPFKNDWSINYKVSFKKNRIKDIEFCINLILYKSDMNIEFYGIPINEIAKYSILYENVKDISKNINPYMEYVFEIIEKMINQLNLKKSSELLMYIIKRYGTLSIKDNSFKRNYYKQYLHKNPKETAVSYLKKYDKLYDSIFCDLVKENKIKSKWYSEQKMYRIVCQIYPNAIYQYKTKWLDLQSLDVFIPELNIGIEYQGLQHFKAVDFFGGEVVFKKNIQRDSIKLEKCKENGVKIIYWNYNEPLLLDTFIKKLAEINIKPDFKCKDKVNEQIKLDYMKYKKVDKIDVLDVEKEKQKIIKQNERKLNDTVKEYIEKNNIDKSKDKNGIRGLFGLFKEIINWSNKIERENEIKKAKALENEMDALELEDWQKELVRNGEFHTTSFDEDEIDEDSYFYEDD